MFTGWAVWGLLLSSALLNFTFVGRLGGYWAGLICIFLAGLPFAIYKIKTDDDEFHLGFVLLTLFICGLMSLIWGTVLQALLLLIHVHHVAGMPIDRWIWKFPDWMLGG